MGAVKQGKNCILVYRSQLVLLREVEALLCEQSKDWGGFIGRD